MLKKLPKNEPSITENPVVQIKVSSREAPSLRKMNSKISFPRRSDKTNKCLRKGENEKYNKRRKRKKESSLGWKHKR